MRFLLLFLGLASTGAVAATPKADLVFTNGKIVTLEAKQPQVTAVAVKDGRILALGSDQEIQHYVGPRTNRIDLKGALAVPGFIEGHGHFTSLGRSLLELDLTKAKNWDEIVQRVADAAKQAKPGQWILGRGWHQEKWDRSPEPNVQGLPLHAGLDRAAPDNPVVLEHASGHGLFVNAAVLSLLKITRDTPDPAGGQIVRDTQGEPIGMLWDNAMAPVRKAYQEELEHRSPRQAAAEFHRELKLAADDAVRKGITTFVDQGESFATLDEIKKFADENGLPLRLYAMVNVTASDADVAGLPEVDDYAKYDGYTQLERFLPAHRVIGDADGHFTVRAVGEVLSDGALGSHTAWFLKPYDDLPSSTGISVTPPADVKRIADLALRDGYQLSVHAIGDRANHEILDVFQAEFAAHPDAKDLRWRIEHAQHLDSADIPRFGKLGVIASMQSVHACSDAPYVVKRLGEERAKAGAYVWRSLMQAGAVIANGTDVPVEDEDPIPNFYCAVTRRAKSDGTPFYPGQVMTREEALRSYTWNNAYAIFEEQELGSLAVGKRADITVLSKDILTVPEQDILKAKVVYTVVGGRIVY